MYRYLIVANHDKKGEREENTVHECESNNGHGDE